MKVRGLHGLAFTRIRMESAQQLTIIPSEFIWPLSFGNKYPFFTTLRGWNHLFSFIVFSHNGITLLFYASLTKMENVYVSFVYCIVFFFPFFLELGEIVFNSRGNVVQDLTANRFVPGLYRMIFILMSKRCKEVSCTINIDVFICAFVKYQIAFIHAEKKIINKLCLLEMKQIKNNIDFQTFGFLQERFWV